VILAFFVRRVAITPGTDLLVSAFNSIIVMLARTRDFIIPHVCFLSPVIVMFGLAIYLLLLILLSFTVVLLHAYYNEDV